MKRSLIAAFFHAEHIVCLTTETTEVLYLLGEQKCIVGSRAIHHYARLKAVTRYYSAMESAPSMQQTLGLVLC